MAFFLRMQSRRLPKNTSDKTTLDCNCNNNGQVLLFYSYQSIINPTLLANTLLSIISQLDLSCKIRISDEGINATLAGTNTEKFMSKFSILPDFIQMNLQRDFFKPSPGCIHAFPDISIKLVKEICPLNIELSPRTNSIPLDPLDFHLKSSSPNSIILDVRNYYESRIGFFKNAIVPNIRRFSSLPDFIKNNRKFFQNKQIFTYCTGGIRCEKASSMIALETGANVFLLNGGIHNYLEWIKKSNYESLFLGKNYVFDARLTNGGNGIVSRCINCNLITPSYHKCHAKGCHLMVVMCELCSQDGIFCCSSCKQMHIDKSKRWICDCERVRRENLDKIVIAAE